MKFSLMRPNVRGFMSREKILWNYSVGDVGIVGQDSLCVAKI